MLRVRRCHAAAVKTFFSYLVEEDVLLFNLATNLVSAKTSSAIPQVLTVEELFQEKIPQKLIDLQLTRQDI